MEEQEIKVRRFKCKCGKSFSKEQKKEHAALVNAGCDVDTITLEEAKAAKMCFDCKL